MNLNRSTALTLRICISVGMLLIAAGLAMSMCGMGDEMLYAGVLALIVSPFIGVVVSFASLLSMKDRFWASIAAILLAVTTVGAAIALF